MDRIEYNSRLRAEVEVLKELYRDDNSAFLIWFLKNIFCLNELTSVDCVCDGRRDKGIDGIWVDENDEEIYIFQSEFSPNDERDTGDTKIREFTGVKSWFQSVESVDNLSRSLINLELKERLNTLKIKDKISRGYNLNYVYVTNKRFDVNATEFLKNTDIDAYDNNSIFNKFTYMVESDISNTPKILNIDNPSAILYNEGKENRSIALAISAKELLKLDGIQDHSLFSRNVRLWAGKNRVNNKMKDTINKQTEHEKFFLYHNGISIICNKFEFRENKNEIEISEYQVINGCQSIISFYQNRDNLTDEIKVLTKIIEVAPQSPLIQEITQNANNQNAVSPKDLKSNDRVQLSLQNYFKEFFDNKVFYKIKRGESTLGYEDYIELDYAAQLIVAFYHEESHKTHLKTSFYGDNYEKIFSRHMDCKKIFLAHAIYKIIENNKEEIEDLAVRAYGLAKFSILRNIHSILEDDSFGKELLEDPSNYLKGGKYRKLNDALVKLFQLVSLDINSYISNYKTENSFFDYKNLFKNKEFCDRMNNSILRDHKKSIVRHPEDSFEQIINGII